MMTIKNILKYLMIFLIVVFLLTLLLTLVAKLPTKYVEKNLKEATTFFEKNSREINYVKRKREYTYLHPWADQVIFNIIYCLDTEKPLESVLEAKYYANNNPDGNNLKYIDLIENKLEGDTEYLRYWHGSIFLIKLLLIFFTLEQIYIVNAFFLSILLLVLLIILIKKKHLEIAVSFLIALVMVSSQYVPFTIEYVWTFYLMFIVSIISVIIENKVGANKNLLNIFFVTGILTCFFDFLTTEILTILVPILIVFSMRFKEKRINSFYNEFIFLVKCMFLWFIAYAGMWFVKWCLSAIILNVDILDSVKDSLMNRVNGQVFNYSQVQLIFAALKRNVFILYPLILIRRKKWIITFGVIAFILSFILVFDKSKKENFKYALILFVFAIIPYLRYIILANHSYCHCFFVFRSQIPVIMGVVLTFINCSDKNKLFSPINKIGSRKN